MAKYVITSPNGENYEITAPDNATEQQVLEYAQNNFGSVQQEQPKREMKEGLLPKIGAGAVAFGQGGLPVFDEAGAYLGEKLVQAGLMNPVAGKGEDEYEKRLANIRGTEKAFAEEYPKTDIGLRLAGGVAATAPFGASLAAAPFRAGAAYGAAQGFAGSEGGTANRLFNGVVGGALGGTLGYGAEKYLAPLVGKIGPKPPLKLKSKELQNIERNLGLAGITKKEYAANLLRSTPDDFAGELGGEALRMQTQAQAKVTGPSMQRAREAMRKRLADAPDRAKKIVQDALGSDEESQLLINALGIAEGAEKTLYGAATGTVPLESFKGVLDTPAGQSAIQNAAKKLANKQINPLEAGFKQVEDKAGNILYALDENVPIETVHEISKSVGDLVKRNYKGAIEDSESYAIEGLRKQLVDALKQSSTDFNAAQSNFAATSAARDAMSRGRSVARASTGEKAEGVLDAALKRDEYAPFTKAGFKQGLYDIMESVPLGTGNPIARIAQEKTAGRIGEIAGKDAADAFRKNVMAEKLRMELANRALFNSNTAETLTANPPDLPVIANTERWILNKVLDKIGGKIGGASNERLAAALYASTPQEKQYLAKVLLGSASPEVKRNAMIEFLRNSRPTLPAQSMGAVANSGGE